jgi:hypothetical protein
MILVYVKLTPVKLIPKESLAMGGEEEKREGGILCFVFSHWLSQVFSLFHIPCNQFEKSDRHTPITLLAIFSMP